MYVGSSLPVTRPDVLAIVDAKRNSKACAHAIKLNDVDAEHALPARRQKIDASLPKFTFATRCSYAALVTVSDAVGRHRLTPK
jgi:hypothetical protein